MASLSTDMDRAHSMELEDYRADRAVTLQAEASESRAASEKLAEGRNEGVPQHSTDEKDLV